MILAPARALARSRPGPAVARLGRSQREQLVPRACRRGCRIIERIDVTTPPLDECDGAGSRIRIDDYSNRKPDSGARRFGFQRALAVARRLDSVAPPVLSPACLRGHVRAGRDACTVPPGPRAPGSGVLRTPPRAPRYFRQDRRSRVTAYAATPAITRRIAYTPRASPADAGGAHLRSAESGRPSLHGRRELRGRLELLRIRRLRGADGQRRLVHRPPEVAARG